MRYLYLVIVLQFALFFPTFGQIQKGNLIISGDVSYSQRSFPQHLVSFPGKEKDLRLMPRIGYMLNDTWAIGLQGGFQAYTQSSESIVERYMQGIYSGQLDNAGNPILYYFMNERTSRTYRENQLWSLGPYVQKFFPLSEKAFLNLSANIVYQGGNNGTFGIQNSYFIPSCPNCLSIVPPAVTELTLKENYWISGVNLGFNYFFTSKLALDLQAELLQWRSGEFDAINTGTQGAYFHLTGPYYDKVNELNFLQNAGGIRIGLLLTL